MFRISFLCLLTIFKEIFSSILDFTDLPTMYFKAFNRPQIFEDTLSAIPKTQLLTEFSTKLHNFGIFGSGQSRELGLTPIHSSNIFTESTVRRKLQNCTCSALVCYEVISQNLQSPFPPQASLKQGIYDSFSV